MTLRAVSNPSLGFPFAGRAKEGKVRRPPQLKRPRKFLSCTAKVFLVEVDLREKL